MTGASATETSLSLSIVADLAAVSVSLPYFGERCSQQGDQQCYNDSHWYSPWSNERWTVSMKFHQLQALVAAIDSGGIRAAARTMNLSQAALTKSLRQLEEQAGIALLTRSSKGVRPTPACEALIARARLITRQFALAEQELQHAAGLGQEVVRFGLTPLLTLTILGPAFRRFRKNYHDVAVQVIEGFLPRAMPMLREGSLDFALVPESSDLQMAEFRTKRIAGIKQCLAVREQHPLLRSRSARAIIDCEWALPASPSKGANPRLDAMFAQAGAGSPRRVVVGDAMSLIALLRSSDLVGLLPTRMLNEPACAGIRAIEIPSLKPPDFDLRIVSRADAPLPKVAAFFARCLTSAVRSELAGAR